MTETAAKTPWHVWLVGVLAVLFNSIGIFDFIMSMTQGAAYMAEAGMTQAQIDHYLSMPGWMTAVWATGVWTAIIGSVLILLRKKAAFPVFALSLAAFLVSLVYTYAIAGAGDVMGQQGAVTSAVITAVLVFLTWYSWAMRKRGVLG